MTRAPHVTRPALASLALACLARAGAALAQVQVDVVPVYGDACLPRTGPTELVVGLTNPGGAAVTGSVRVESVGGAYQPGVRTIPAVPFNLGPRGRATIRVPSPPGGLGGGDVVLQVYAGARAIAQQPLRYQSPVDAILLDATPQARLAFALRAANTNDPMAPPTAPSPLATLAAGLSPCPALRVPQTGEVVLPRTLAGYNGVAMVVADAGTVMSLPATERTALADYVLSGGTLTVIPQRADELRHPTLAALFGSNVTAVTPAPLDPASAQWLGMAAGATPGSFPNPTTLQNVQSFQGGNLHTRALAPLFPWGAANLLGGSAEYGFGHAHALAVNPTMPPAIEDPWAVSIATRLAQQANGGRAGRLIDDTPEVAQVPAMVRRALDPNEGFRPGLGLAVVLLVLYAVLAGPVSFRLAARRGRPLRGLALLPLWSALVFGGIVALGGVSRGFQGRARRFAVMELPAGMPRGALRRYHGYFSGDTGGIEVVAYGHDRRLYADPASGTGYVTLNLERDRATLRGLALTPWTTSVVREEGYETLAGAVTLQPDPAGRVRVVNRTGAPLREVLLIAPGGTEAWMFREIGPGQSQLATSGVVVPPQVLTSLAAGGAGASAWPPTSLSSNPGWHPGLQVATLFGGDEDAVKRWDALLASLPRAAASNPSAPVLLGQLALPLPSDDDGGLRVDADTTFVRVVGWGGAP